MSGVRGSVVVVTPPSGWAVTLGELRGHLEMGDDTAHDATLLGALASATDVVERITGRALLTQTLRLVLPAFAPVIYLPRAPVQSVSSIAYVDSAGVTQTLDPTDYLAALSDGWRPSVAPAYGKCWPGTRCQREAVLVTYVAGYGGHNDVPWGIRHALKMLVAAWFSTREMAPTDGVLDLLENYRLRSF